MSSDYSLQSTDGDGLMDVVDGIDVIDVMDMVGVVILPIAHCVLLIGYCLLVNG